MEAINYLYGALGLAYIVPFLFVLTIVVFFHELGHFYAARRCGVRVEVFSVGFGRALALSGKSAGCRWAVTSNSLAMKTKPARPMRIS